MKRKKIPGSKYELCLEDDQNQWFFRLRINEALEEEIPLTHLDEKAIRNNIVELVGAAHISLNDIQIDLLLNEFWNYVKNKLSEQKRELKYSKELMKDSRYNDLVKRIKKLSKKAKKLEERVTHFESKYT